MGHDRRLKSLALTLLPDRALLAVKKRHYVRAVRDFSPPEAPVLQALVQRGDHVLDVGANVGWYTKLLSELVGPGGRVFSAEPVPPTFELLSFCVRSLRLDNVELVDCALSDGAGWATMEVPRYADGGENYYEAELVEDRQAASGSDLRRFRVRRDAIDSRFGGCRAPAFIKIDVEGHECAVLRGGRGLICRARPALFVEVIGDLDDAHSESRATATCLAAEGYRPYWFDGARLRRREAGDPPRNYFFLTGLHLARLTAQGLKAA
ncbi:MAG: FkbM family methyltransferase [Candidatus Rokubacteria bacterium]|nr:FkbM family methyltransferase [Candidatus Rokubacteria bacterium]